MFHLKPSTINITTQEIDEVKSLSLNQLKEQLKSNKASTTPNNAINAMNLTSYLSDNEEDPEKMVIEPDQFENIAGSPLIPKQQERK